MSNIDAATKDIVDKWSGHLDVIAKAQGELKQLKAEAKDEGYNLKCLAQAVKEKRKGAKYQAEQLTLELELQSYRKSVGLPTDVADAQERARREAEQGPAGDDEASVFGENDTVQFGDGPEIPARDFERAARKMKRGLQ